MQQISCLHLSIFSCIFFGAKYNLVINCDKTVMKWIELASCVQRLLQSESSCEMLREMLCYLSLKFKSDMD